MVDERDIESKIVFVNEFRNNIIRSMNVRIKISQKRIQAIKILEKNHQDQKGINLLRRCIKNERWFLRIIEGGLREALYDLNKNYQWISQNIRDRATRNKSTRLIEIVNIYFSKIHNIEYRLELEEAFIKRQDKDSFREFVEQWNKEIELNRKLLKKTIDTSDLEDYFKKLNVIIPKVLKAGILGGALGAFIRKFYLLPEFSDKIGQPLSENKQILLTAGILALFGAVATLMAALDEIEREIELINIKELNKAKKSI